MWIVRLRKHLSQETGKVDQERERESYLPVQNILKDVVLQRAIRG